jgi:hypothetical protein
MSHSIWNYERILKCMYGGFINVIVIFISSQLTHLKSTSQVVHLKCTLQVSILLRKLPFNFCILKTLLLHVLEIFFVTIQSVQ